MAYKKICRWVLLASVLLFLVPARYGWAIDLNDHPKVAAVADKLVASGHYSQTELDTLFAKAQVKQSVLNAMMNPAEYKFTWGKYRKLFLKDDRIQQGVEFWQQHHQELTRAENQYGVPAEIIVAIIGVESKFGKYKGKYKVLDSLVSLVTGYPRRSKFFASELEQFLILSKENGLDATKILGSYAGAVGYPQFISSSYRNYAVDFNADGRTDLINQVDDAIGSIANYFIENGWRPGEPVTSKSTVEVSRAVQQLASRKRKVQHTAEHLRAKGAVLNAEIDDGEKFGVLMLDAGDVVFDKKTPNTYIVRAGDTACQIAERFKVSCKRLIKLNSLNAQATIFRGQRLKLPAGANSAPATSSADTKWTVKGNVSNKLEGSSDISATESGPQPIYFYTHRNFYAITQYNHSVLYAMAVYDLSEAIAAQYSKTVSINQ